MDFEGFLKDLSSFLDKNQILLEKEDVLFYSLDRTKDFEPNGSCVVFPKSTEEVQKLFY